MQDVQIVYCPSCGAPVKFLENREDTFCTSCGHQLFREDTHLEMKLKHEEVKMEYQDRSEERRLKEEAEKRNEKEKWIVLALSFGLLILIFAVIIIESVFLH